MAYTQKELAVLFRRFHAAKAAEAEAKKLSAEIKSAIADLISSGVIAAGEAVTAGGYTAHVTVAKAAPTFDKSAFAADHPDLYEKYSRVGKSIERLYFK